MCKEDSNQSKIIPVKITEAIIEKKIEIRG
jgi:hypothetical protein